MKCSCIELLIQKPKEIVGIVLGREANDIRHVSLRLDHKKKLGAIDLHELKRSVQRPGRFWLFICPLCGYPECWGINKPVLVTHRDGFVRWQLDRHNSPAKRSYSLLLPKAAMRSAIREVEAEIAGIAPGARPLTIVGTDRNK